MKTFLSRLFLLCTLFVPMLAAHAEPAQHGQPSAPASFVVITHVDLLPDTAVPNGVETGIALLKNYVQGTSHANGNRSAVLITWAPTNNHFQVIEVWSSRAAFEAYIGTSAAIAFRNSLQGLIGSPYEQRLYYSTNVPDSHPNGDTTASPFK